MFVGDNAAGNGAAVVAVRDGFPKPQQMQMVASDLNQSETAFLAMGGEVPQIRWFTPSTEVALCAHATLAAASYLRDAGHGEERMTFRSAEGPLQVRVDSQRLWLTLQRKKLRPDYASSEGWLRNVVRGTPAKAQPYRLLGVDWHSDELERNVILEVFCDLKQISVDFDAVNALPVGGVVLTSESIDSTRFDFDLRYFAPRCGIPEDAATGSVQAALAPIWAERKGRTSLTAFQRSERGGIIYVDVDEDVVNVGGDCRRIATLNVARLEG